LRFFSVLLWFGFLFQPGFAESFEGEPWIRVGLGRPDSQPLFFYKGSLAILDGEKEVKQLNLNGRFWVIQESGTSSSYCLRLASGERDALDDSMKELRKSHPGVSFHVIKHRSSSDAFLETGRIDSKKKAEDLLGNLKKGGYPQAKLIKLGSAKGTSYTIVDQRFDKHVLGSLKHLGLRPVIESGVLTFSGKEYRGTLEIRPSGKRLRVINFLPMETYLRGVVPGEMGPVVYPRLEALKAQAIAARTYAIKNMGKFKSRGYDICDTPACQVYKGVQVEHELSDQAIKETAGMVLSSGGELIDALYTSTCGGATDPVDNVFTNRSGDVDSYLAGASSYLKKNSGWKMALPRNDQLKNYSSLQIEAYLLRIQNPDVIGTLNTSTLKEWMSDLEWIFGASKTPANSEVWTMKLLLDYLSELPFVAKAAQFQCSPEDLKRYSKYAERDIPLPWFFMMRYGVLGEWDLEKTSRTLTKQETLSFLVRMAQVLGPEQTWQRFFVDHLTEKGIVLRDWNGVYEYPLEQLDLVLSKSVEDWKVNPHIYFQMWDKVYLLDGSQDSGIIYHRSSGWAASVDRSSPYSSWIEKKTITEIEELTRKYYPKIRGVRDFKILEQAPTGRVVKLELLADTGRHIIEGLKIRRILGIRDTLFEFLPQYQNGRLHTVTFVGKGWGHGVGMSQVGAFGLALEGWTHDQILKHYYSNVELVHYNSLK